MAVHGLPPFDPRPGARRLRASLRAHALKAPQVHSEDLHCQARDGATLALRLYRPCAPAEQPLPVLLYLHGGGFVVGSIASHDGVCREFCARTPARC